MASFRKHNNGSWEYRIKIKDPVSNKFKEKSKRGFPTKKAAQLAAAKVEQEISNGTFITNNSTTFKQVFDNWWASHSRTLKPSTLYSLGSKFNKHILPRLGHLRIQDITKEYCQKMIDEIAEQINSVNDVKIQANQVFKYAVRMEYIVKNPMEHVIIPKKEADFLVEEPKRNFWTKQEIKDFFMLAKLKLNKQDYVMFHLLIYTGMRKGELLSLEWNDIDFDEHAIFISKTLFFKDDKQIIQKAKTYQTRTIHIDTKTVDILKKWRIQQQKHVLNSNDTLGIKNVLTREDKRPLRLAYPNDKLESFIKTHNLHPITVHGFRHTHASILFEAGATVKEVQVRLGHRDIKTTMNIYTHVTKAVKERTAELFQSYIDI
ncbi:site-specific integrase [Bacillus safensis]|uniref:Integrase n=1 Tax=Bacillus safensis TaxID=561879 RepID=A0A1L6ZD95_BACIA|nr:site-specific integrase [Bacillus safensis]APT44485.1 integrase [Bacillus safensis]MCY7565599.1 site-specific integrase [Bacillus safensis]MCY7627426.1 site-specific integrase [Bacillus safensis]MCY7634382.1 site-specific integrase [Bacillus safensis]MCY7650103.1 site-specific integrase [Bacillus safensis]